MGLREKLGGDLSYLIHGFLSLCCIQYQYSIIYFQIQNRISLERMCSIIMNAHTVTCAAQNFGPGNTMGFRYAVPGYGGIECTVVANVIAGMW
jgi:hypothetical protein